MNRRWLAAVVLVMGVGNVVPWGLAADRLELTVPVADGAFIAGQEVAVTVKAVEGRLPVELTVEHFDLLTEETRRLEYRPGSDGIFRPGPVPNGIHRFTFSGTGLEPAPITVAVAPALLARDLPEDWPLATHHYGQGLLTAPMPGFKWYRTFLSWRVLNPRPGVYDWSPLDKVVDDLAAVGGRLLVCLEGAPVWTSAKARQDYASEQNVDIRTDLASHWAPDDWQSLRDFAQAFVERYRDSPVVGAVEPWNEPNANLRWKDSYASLVELHKIWFEETRRTKGRIRIAGLSISPGHHVEYVDGLVEAGILDYLDILAGHFYEERGSHSRLNARNNLDLHLDLLRAPLIRSGRWLPIWDTEGGMGFEVIAAGAVREGGRIETQDEAVARLRANPAFNPERPWDTWPNPTERRFAAWAVSFTTAVLGQGVVKNFTFHPNWYILDGALNLPWVSNATFGSVLSEVDYRYVIPIGLAEERGVESDDPAIGAYAYRIGRPGEKQVLVVWADRISPRSAFPALWAPWIQPVKIRIPTKAGSVTVEDLYRRTKKTITAEDEVITIEAGEEPVFVWGWEFKDI